MKSLSKNRFWLLSVLAGLFFVGLIVSASAAERDPIRQDVLTFSGTQPVSESSLAADSYIIPLRCNTADQQTYSIIIRNVDPIERALLLDAQDGKWDRFDLFRAALIVEGERNPEKIRRYDERLNNLVADVKARLKTGNNLTPQALTRELFETMHRELLTKDYNLDCTEIGKVMSTGHFNCVSATVLFNCLAEKAGLDVYALEMPGHALSRVKFEGVSVDLETTCPNWFSLQNNAERLNATTRRIAQAPATVNPVTGNAMTTVNIAPPPIENLEDLSKKLREVTPVQLVATIYYNIGVDKHARQQFAEMAAANAKAIYLDRKNQTAWGNMLAAINNWALELVADKGKERFDIAAVLLDQGLMLDPTYENFKVNQRHVFYYWIYGLALRQRFDDAEKVFTFADPRLPNDASIAELMQSIRKHSQKQK
ncbi:hypothetical protein FACS189454_02790 [Planctomycetales bacterium]|nr:hypothetical protein FACS189454_02790 [Planctomycetales bacterium]